MATTTVNLGLSLDGLSNVDTAGKANGNILVWNSTSNKWEDAAPSGGGTPAGITGQVQFNNAGVFAADSNFVWDNTNKRLGVGATPASTVRLDVRAQGALSTDVAFRVRNSADTRNFLIVQGNGNVYNSGTSNLASNTFFGSGAGNATSGASNTFIGQNAGLSNTSGSDNTFIGFRAGEATTVEKQNTFVGSLTGFSNTTGQQNTYLGRQAGFSNNGSQNVFIGAPSASAATSASSCISIGWGAALGAVNSTNEIVIGTSASGAGSNTATLGNTSIVKTILRGTLNAAGLPTSSVGLVAGDIWNNGGVLNIV